MPRERRLSQHNLFGDTFARSHGSIAVVEGGKALRLLDIETNNHGYGKDSRSMIKWRQLFHYEQPSSAWSCCRNHPDIRSCRSERLQRPDVRLHVPPLYGMCERFAAGTVQTDGDTSDA